MGMAILRLSPALSLACAVVSFPCRPSSQLRAPSRSTLICLAATPKVPLPIASPGSLGDDPSKWDPAECDALLRGGEQVASVLQEMLTLVGSCFVFVRFICQDSGVIVSRILNAQSANLMLL